MKYITSTIGYYTVKQAPADLKNQLADINVQCGWVIISLKDNGIEFN
jgi:hypothetical protein